MKTVQVDGKRVNDVAGLKQALDDAAFLVIGVSAQQGAAPFVRVHLEDAEAKDPTAIVNAWQDPAVLKATSNKPAGVGGVPEAVADGVDKHTLTLQKTDPNTGQVVPGTETLQVIPSQLIAVSNSRPTLVAGQVTVDVGPTTMVGELSVRVVDSGGSLVETAIKIRFA